MDHSGASETFDYQAGWVVNEDAPPGSVEAKAPYVDNGTALLDATRYYDPAFKQREWDHMWTRTWLLAGRVSDVAEPGDFFTFRIGTENLIVVRSSDGELRAFYNVCQHRGTQIVTTDFGSAAKFRCLYHSWAWTNDGKIAEVTDQETFRPAVLGGELDLPRVRCETWAGFVFINMDTNAPPLSRQLGVLPSHLDSFRMQEMVVVKEVQVEWPVNWKTALDAFLESYHAHAVHPEIMPFMDDYHQQYDCYDQGISRMLIMFGALSPRHPDQTSIGDMLARMLSEAGIDPASFQGTAQDVRAAIQKKKITQPGLETFLPAHMTDDWNYAVFPNITFNLHPEGCLVQRFRPHATDPEKMIYDVVVLMRPISDPSVEAPFYMGVEPGTDLSGASRPDRGYLTKGDGGLGYVLEQDSTMVPFVQSGMRSRSFKGARLSEQEVRLRHYHRELDRYLADENRLHS